jgi:hypothetical protein
MVYIQITKPTKEPRTLPYTSKTKRYTVFKTNTHMAPKPMFKDRASFLAHPENR